MKEAKSINSLNQIYQLHTQFTLRMIAGCLFGTVLQWRVSCTWSAEWCGICCLVEAVGELV